MKMRKNIQRFQKINQKIKNLTEDLIEASKISSGNETVNLQKLNFAEMILQANGEFAEKYESKDLKLISKIEKRGSLRNQIAKKCGEYQKIYTIMHINILQKGQEYM